MDIYDVFVGFPDDHHVDVVFGGLHLPAPAHPPMVPAIVPYVTRQLANLPADADKLIDLLLSTIENDLEADAPGTRYGPVIQSLLKAFHAGPPQLEDFDIFRATVLSKRGPRYRRFFLGRVPVGGRTTAIGIQLSAKGFGLRGDEVADATARSIGAVVAAGFREIEPAALAAWREIERTGEAEERLASQAEEDRAAFEYQLLLLREAEALAEISLVTALTAIARHALSAGITPFNQIDVNKNVMAEVWPHFQDCLAAIKMVSDEFSSNEKHSSSDP